MIGIFKKAEYKKTERITIPELNVDGVILKTEGRSWNGEPVYRVSHKNPGYDGTKLEVPATIEANFKESQLERKSFE